MKDLLIFDMDGVLVEVTESYRAAIQETVQHFAGYTPTNNEIQDWKNQGGWNDDWNLSHRLISERGCKVAFDEVVTYFQHIFLHRDKDPLILREQWIARAGLFENLAQDFHLAVFTGRLHEEAMLTLNRFQPGTFQTVVGVDDVAHPKPDPEGLRKIVDQVPHRNCWYVGDSVDDARASRGAGIPFIGIAAEANPRFEELAALLRSDGAISILSDINKLNEVLAHAR